MKITFKEDSYSGYNDPAFIAQNDLGPSSEQLKISIHSTVKCTKHVLPVINVIRYKVFLQGPAGVVGLS